MLALNVPEEHTGLLRILEKLGPSLAEIALPAQAPYLGAYSGTLLALQQQCTALKHLDLGGVKHVALEKLLEVNSKRMESLKLPGVISIETANSIRQHCIGLKKLCINLKLGLPRIEEYEAEVSEDEPDNEAEGADDDIMAGEGSEGHGMEEDAVEADNGISSDEEVNEGAQNIAHFFISVGQTLEQLSLGFYVEDASRAAVSACFKLIEVHCRNLRIIEVPALGQQMHQALSDLFISYGAQLERATVHNMHPELCAKVVKACPNLRTVCTGFDTLTAERMAALGWSLRCIQFEWRRPPPGVDVNDFEAAAKLCPNVRYVHARDVGLWAARIFRAITNLRKVHIELFFGLPPAHIAKVLDSIANGSTSITDFIYKGDLPADGAFRKLAENNPLLEKVAIKVRHREGIYWPNDVWEPYGECLADIVVSFLGCARLRDIIIIDHGYPNFHPDVLPAAPRRTAVADACSRYRARRLFIHVLGVDYLK